MTWKTPNAACRTWWWSRTVDDPDAPGSDEMEGDDAVERRQVHSPDEANLIGSLCGAPTNSFNADGHPETPGANGDLHMPAIDIDLPVKVVESSTPGNHHLFIDVPMTWAQYARLLRVMAEVGLVEQGYVEASLRRGQTFVRSGKTKPKRA